MKKNTKSILAIIFALIIIIGIFTACTAGKGNDEAANGTTEAKETVSAVSEESTS